jgi:hypothetical protein
VQFFKSVTALAGLLCFDNLVLGRGLGSITPVRFAFGSGVFRELPLALAAGLVRRTSVDLAGRIGIVSTEGYVRSNLSDLVRVSCVRLGLTVVGRSTISSVRASDAVTLVANNPPRTARQRAAIQTVLINLDPQRFALIIATAIERN